MRIAVVGAGSVGATLGQAWLERGEDVIWGVRNPSDPKYAALPRERVKTAAEAAKGAEVVVIATPWSAAEAAIKSLGSLAGKIVIDCMNPLGMGPDGLQLVLGFNTSAGEQVASWAPGAFVFKALNTTGAGNMATAGDFPVKPVMPVAGDDAGRKPTARGQARFRTGGCRAIEERPAAGADGHVLDRPGDEARPRARVRVSAGRQEVMF